MRFTKLVVESFQAIQRAEVEFGPGLNVLYGPNDLGKSTLATAIRAALLVTPGSAEGSNFTPWYADATPVVVLTFSDDSGHYWKVRKGFGGSGANTGAELQHSKDGQSFSLDCKARQVEERIRGLLAWGIPAPGGKGSPRGLPTSFLANALLGAQTDVDAILASSLDNDLDSSGKLRLTKALATLAQDPLFKRVFDAAQLEVDQCFTATGKRKRGQTSKFTEAGQHVKQLGAELATLQRQLVDSATVEEMVNALRERRGQAHMRVGDLAAALLAVQERLTNTRAREHGVKQVDAAKLALSLIDQHAARVSALSDRVDVLVGQVGARDGDVARTLSDAGIADRDARAAEEALRMATSADGARERELRRAQLAEQSAQLKTKKQAADTLKITVTGAIAARAEAKDAGLAEKTALADLEKAKVGVEDSRERVREAERGVELARAILAYGRWRAASVAAEDSVRAGQAATKARGEAAEKDAAAATLEGEARTIDESLAAHRASLPTGEEAKALGRLEHELEVAEAALGGGLSVKVTPRTSLRMRTVLDEEPAVDEAAVTAERVFEAERTIQLSIGDLVDIEVTAGAADTRRGVESLRTRWGAEAVPVLERAGLSAVKELLNAIDAIAKEASRVTELTQRAAQLRAEATSLRERAALHEEQAAKGAGNSSDLDARREAIGTTDHLVLQTHFEKLGSAWESRADAGHTQKANEQKVAQTKLATLEQAATVAEYRVSDVRQHAAKVTAASDAALASLGVKDADALLRSTEEEIGSLAQRVDGIERELLALAAEASAQVESATRTLEEAKRRIVTAKEAHHAAVAAAETAKAELNERLGERSAMREQLAAMDRVAASALCVLREGELAALPKLVAASEEDVAAADKEAAAAGRELEAVKEELHTSEGALSKVGGAALRDEVERVQEALDAASLREKDLEIDAEGWMLLRDTLRAVENDEGAHLGRALAGPVATRFRELTGGRYKDLRLDAKLQTESINVATGVAGVDVLKALSVGTRDQLATLIRVAIAEQLQTAIVLDDHLVHTDPKRLAWFRDVLTQTALTTQVIVFTCRPEDYLLKSELPDTSPTRDVAGGMVRAIDMVRLVKRWEGVASSPPPPRMDGART